MNFKCSICGEIHDAGDMSWNFPEPLPWLGATDEERARSYLTDDQCELVARDAVHYFIRGQLEIPIKNTGRIFTWSVWCSLSEASHMEISYHWESSTRTELAPHFGWLCSRIPHYPDTLHLKTHVHQRAVGLRPFVELERTAHPLAVDQREGIDAARLNELHSRLLHEYKNRDGGDPD
jgi:hypothetical protein